MSGAAKAISAVLFVLLIAAAAIWFIQHERGQTLRSAGDRVEDAIRDL